MIQQLWIPNTFPSLNDVVDAAKGAGGRGTNYSAMKNQLTTSVMILAKSARLKPMPFAHFFYLFFEKNKQRDKSNIFVAVKFIEDGLVAAKVIKNDGWKQVLSIAQDFKVCPTKPGVMMYMADNINELPFL